MKLTREEQELIHNNEELIGHILSSFSFFKKFKVGDYLIAYERGTKKLIVNSYNTPQKFQVVLEDKHGLPYIKKLGINGQPVGTLICALKFDSYNNRFESNLYYDFDVDPDFTDAVILQEEDGFNPSVSHKNKATTFKDITNYNKNIRLCLDTDKKRWDYIKSLKVGDIVWKSSTTFWVIQSIIPITPQIEALSSQWKAPKIITIKHSNGKIQEKTFWDFNTKSFYIKQPRSYKKEVYNPNL